MIVWFILCDLVTIAVISTDDGLLVISNCAEGHSYFIIDRRISVDEARSLRNSSCFDRLYAACRHNSMISGTQQRSNTSKISTNLTWVISPDNKKMGSNSNLNSVDNIHIAPANRSFTCLFWKDEIIGIQRNELTTIWIYLKCNVLYGNVRSPASYFNDGKHFLLLYIFTWLCWLLQLLRHPSYYDHLMITY